MLVISSLAAGQALGVELTPFLAEVSVNHQVHGPRIMRWDGMGEVFVSASELREWGVHPPYPEPRRHEGELLYSLTDFPDAQVALNPRDASMAVNFPADRIGTNQQLLVDKETTRVRQGTGAYLDYDLSYTDAGESFASAFLAPTVFSRFGSLDNQWVYRGGGATADGEWEDGWIRLDTTYSLDDPENMRSFRAGDLIGMPGPWGGAYRLGGIQLATNFGTRPTYVTFPVPSVGGDARLPSTVDLYVNGALRSRESVDPGQFEINDIPVTTGDGQVRMVVTDVLGREQVYSQDFYASSELLREGLSEYSYSLGALRRNYGGISNDYDDIALLGSHRYGLSSQLTVGGRLDATDDTQVLGSSADWSPGRAGVFSSAIAFSHSDRGNGSAGLVGYQLQRYDFRLGAQLISTSSRFSLLDDENEFSTPDLQMIVNAGWSDVLGGSFGATAVHQKFDSLPQRTIYTLSHNRIVGGDYSFSFYASYISDDRSDYSLGLTVSRSFGPRHSVSTYVGREFDESRARVEVQKSLPSGTGMGYRLGATGGDQDQLDASLAAQNEMGRALLEIQDSREYRSWRASTTGSITWLDGRAYMAREVGQGFAVAQVGDFSNVRVYVENQEVGRTDGSGKLLLPGLRPYENNQVRIEPLDLPMGTNIGILDQTVAPAYRSGTVLDFQVRRSRPVMFTAVLGDGVFVPEGATVHQTDVNEASLVGMDGNVFLPDLGEDAALKISWGDAFCMVEVVAPKSDETLPHLGDVPCEVISP